MDMKIREKRTQISNSSYNTLTFNSSHIPRIYHIKVNNVDRQTQTNKKKTNIQDMKIIRTEMKNNRHAERKMIGSSHFLFVCTVCINARTMLVCTYRKSCIQRIRVINLC